MDFLKENYSFAQSWQKMRHVEILLKFLLTSLEAATKFWARTAAFFWYLLKTKMMFSPEVKMWYSTIDDSYLMYPESI